jgi:hypothetical protein
VTVRPLLHRFRPCERGRVAPLAQTRTNAVAWRGAVRCVTARLGRWEGAATGRCAAGPILNCKYFTSTCERDPDWSGSVPTPQLRQGCWKRRRLAETSRCCVFQPRGATTRSAPIATPALSSRARLVLQPRSSCASGVEVRPHCSQLGRPVGVGKARRTHGGKS